MKFSELENGGGYFVLIDNSPQILLYKDTKGNARKYCDSTIVSVELDAQIQQVLLK